LSCAFMGTGIIPMINRPAKNGAKKNLRMSFSMTNCQPKRNA